MALGASFFVLASTTGAQSKVEGRKVLLAHPPEFEQPQWKTGPPPAQEVEKAYRAKNAAKLFELAVHSLADPKRTFMREPDTSRPGPPKVSPELAATLKNNLYVIPLIRKGLEFELSVDTNNIWSLGFETFAQNRYLAKVVCWCGDLAWNEGHLDEALDDYELGFRLGAQLLRSCNTFIRELTGVGTESIGRGRLKKLAPFLRSGSMLDVAHFLKREVDQETPISKIVTSELDGDLDRLLSQPTKSDFALDRKSLKEMTTFKPTWRKVVAKRAKRYFLPFSKRDRSTPQPARKSPLVVKSFYETFSVDDLNWAGYLRNDFSNRALALDMAALAYGAKNKSWPTKIEELSPGILDLNTHDPFLPSHKLGMLVRNGDLVIYSVGPDGKDDQGLKPITKNFGPDAKGDLVATLGPPKA